MLKLVFIASSLPTRGFQHPGRPATVRLPPGDAPNPGPWQRSPTLNRLAPAHEAAEDGAHMNSKAPVIILTVLCIGLAVGLVWRHNKARDELQAAAAQHQEMLAKLAAAEAREAALQSTNTTLRADREATRASLDRTAAQLGETREILQRTQAAVETATGALKAKEVELSKRDGRIIELEGQNTALDRQASEMKGAITNLEGRITATQKQLETAQGDRDVLIEELHRLQTEKAEMERRLQDVVALKEQIVKLRDQLSLSRQLETIRRSLYGAEPAKSGEALPRGMQPTRAPGARDLEVEIRRDGSATVITVPTNAPPARP
jgi:DNA repair exonuclease SbcCD ATPase subunit